MMLSKQPARNKLLYLMYTESHQFKINFFIVKYMAQFMSQNVLIPLVVVYVPQLRFMQHFIQSCKILIM